MESLRFKVDTRQTSDMKFFAVLANSPRMEALTVTLLFLIVCRAALSESDGAKQEGCGISQGNDDFKFVFEYTQKFKNPDVIKEFESYLERGLLGKNETFSMRDSEIRAQTISIIDLLLNIKENEVELYTTLDKWLLNRLNSEQYSYALAIAFINRPDFRKSDALPVWYTSQPNYFVPQSILQEMNAEIEEGTFNSSKVRLIVPDESDRTAYFREDPDLNRMYYNWNLFFPTWMDPDKYNITNWPLRGEVYYDFHNQLSTVYFMRSMTNVTQFLEQWVEPIKEGYKTDLANAIGQRFSSRVPNQPLIKNQEFKEVMDIVDKMITTSRREEIYVDESFSIHYNETEGYLLTSVLSNLMYNTSDSISPDHYKSFYDAVVVYLASLGSHPGKDCGGLAGNPLTILRDPAVYEMFAHVNALSKDYRELRSDSYTKDEIFDEALTLVSLDVDRLETFYEPFPIDVRVALGRKCEIGKYIVTQLILNHSPFKMRLEINNKGGHNKTALVTVFLLGNIFADNEPEMIQPIDSFRADVVPGTNKIIRDIADSRIFTDDNMIPCGIPKRLILPKGTEEGLKMMMVAIISPYFGADQDEDDKDWKERSPLCGNIRLNHGRGFAFPFDRSTPEAMVRQMVAFHNATIYHKRQTFAGSVTI